MHCREIYVRAIPLETRRGMPFPKWQGVKMLEKVVGGNENCRGGSGRGSKSGKMVGGSTKVVGGVKIRKMADGHRK